MNSSRCVALLILVLTASAAAGAKDANPRQDVDRLTDKQFCPALGKALRAPTAENMAYRTALVERALQREGVTSTMLYGIKTGQPAIGMNVCAVIAALGYPDRRNRTVGPRGEHYQLVYSRRALYVYLDNYIVSAWQD